VKTSGARADDFVEVFHDRIRETIMSRLSPESLRDRHARLAAALEGREDSKPEALAAHWEAAGDRTRAARYAQKAAVVAEAALAFDRAARFYRAALTLIDHTAEERRALTINLANALAATGRGREAAQQFLAAASGLPAEEALPLRRQAMEYLLESGHLDEGTRVVREVLAAVGLDYPETPTAALWSLLKDKARVAVRGRRWTDRKNPAPSLQLNRLDSCWSISESVNLVDFVRSAAFGYRYVRLALRYGDAERVCKAFALDAAIAAAEGNRKKYSSLIRSARSLVPAGENPHLDGVLEYAQSVAHHCLTDWSQSLEHSVRALRILSELGTPFVFEGTRARLFRGWNLCMLGRLAEVNDELPSLMRDARERGDLLSEMGYAASLYGFAWLGSNRPAELRARIDSAAREWNLPGYQVSHWWLAHSSLLVRLYSGDAAGAHAEVERHWRLLSRSHLLRVLVRRMHATELRAQTCIALALQDPAERNRLVLAGRLARQLATSKVTCEQASGLLLQAQLAFVDGNEDGTAKYLTGALRRYDELSMQLHGTVIRRQLGKLLGGVDGASLRAEAERYMHEQNIIDPERMAATIAPGFAR
jgi:eukaryotic-like serine/threonine-protein kinase